MTPRPTANFPRAARLAVPLAIVLTASLAACGSGTKSSTESSSAASSTNAAASSTSKAASKAASTTASQAVPARSVNICTAVPPATVVQLTGKQYTVATPGTIGVGISCAYDDVDSSDDGVTLSYATSGAEDTWKAVHTGSLTDISGVGDKAFWDNTNTLYAVSGSTIIQINGLDSQSASTALAKTLIAALH